MLLVSFLLVIVATIFLLSGLFLTKDLALIFISIACSALAGIVLVVVALALLLGYVLPTILRRSRAAQMAAARPGQKRQVNRRRR